MKNNGFTLIEILGVIVVLAVISLITIPLIDNSLNKGKSNLSKTQEKQIIKGLKEYYADHLSEFNAVSTTGSCKTISELIAQGYLPTDIHNLKTGETYSDDVKVCAKKVGNNYDYYIEQN